MEKRQQPDEGQSTTPAEMQGIVTSDAVSGRRRLRVHILPKIMGIFILILLAIGCGAWYWWHNNRQTNQASQTSIGQSTPEQKVTDKAQTMALAGNYQASQDYLKTQINGTSDSATQADYNNQMAANAANEQQWSEAVQYATKADALVPTMQSAYLLGVAQEGAGNKPAALSAYKNALARMTSDEKKRMPGKVESYDMKIQELSQ